MHVHEGITYVDCLLAKVVATATGRRVMQWRRAWVPLVNAEFGRVLQLRCPSDLWINGREVMEVGRSSPELPAPSKAVG